MADAPNLLDIGPPRIDTKDPARGAAQTGEWLRELHGTMVDTDSDRVARIEALESEKSGALAKKDTVAAGDIEDRAADFDKLPEADQGEFMGRASSGSGSFEKLTRAQVLATLGFEFARSEGADMTTGNTTYSAEHGLSRAPDEVIAWIEANDNDKGFAAGDMVWLPIGAFDGGAQHELFVSANETHVVISQQRTPRMPDKSPGATLSEINPSKWDLYFVARILPS